MRVHGLEWCLFNRTPAFDDIIARMEEQEKREAQEKSSPRSSETADSESDGPRRRAGWKATEAAQSGEDPSRVRTGPSLASQSSSRGVLMLTRRPFLLHSYLSDQPDGVRRPAAPAPGEGSSADVRVPADDGRVHDERRQLAA